MRNKLNLLMLIIFMSMLYACSDDAVIVSEEVPEIPKKTDAEEPDVSGLPRLRVVGRYLKNERGESVNLHGFAQTYSPFFNQNSWNNYDVSGCLRYNQGLIDKMLDKGWRMNFIRLHMDPYWSDDPTQESVRYEGHERFSPVRFEKYLSEVFIPMAEYAIRKGLYVVMRPPGVCPEKIAVGDDYNQYLEKVWSIVSKHPKIKANSGIMFELANEPINILGTDGTYGSNRQVYFDNAKKFFQTIVDKIRVNATNIIWIPGLSYQSSFSGYATNPVEGDNIGYAVHAYPGWYGSDAEEPSAELGGVTGGGYESFQRGWNAQVQPIADIAPVMVTEMDWAPAKYDSSWGKSITGTVGEAGFGANFKYIADNTGNVSWLVFTDCSLLAQFKDEEGLPGAYTFLNDPEACPWPVYHWFKEYASEEVTESEITELEIVGVKGYVDILTGSDRFLVVKALYADGHQRMVTNEVTYNSTNPSIVKVEANGRIVALKDGTSTVTVNYTSQQGSRAISLEVHATTFPLTEKGFDASIWETGTFDESTKTLVTGNYGFGGWQYSNGLDLSGYRQLVVEIGNDNDCSASFRLFDVNNYWSNPAVYDFGNSRRIMVDLNNMLNNNQEKLDPSHLYIIGFWTVGGKPLVIERISLVE
ncbi:MULTISPECIES: cellulase family glycosylhydrolase [Bacteroides]|uniref:cellulase family glycosylhydrolase n=2 Tax=Bacteroides TaxID=816 RepID=UPI0023F820B8|nr:cellulase family glycosylhydrolase [Bacteroides congonensis]